MTQLVRNLQKVVKFDIKLLDKHVSILRSLLGVSDYDVSVDCVDDDTIQRYNHEYRNLNEPTDVLAFPFFDDIEPGKLPEEEFPDDKLLGDILLGLPYIHKGCLEKNEQLNQVLPVMVLHGLCHLTGYDHETEEQWKLMYAKELNILKKFNERTGYDCKPLLGVGH